MPAFGGVASVLGIKCVNLLSCACGYCFGKGDCDVQLDKDTNSGVEGELLASLGGSWPQVWPFFFFIWENYNELECEKSCLNGRHAVSFSAHPFSLLHLSLLWLAEVWLFWHHFWLVMNPFRPIPFYFSVKVNVWCKWTLTSSGWLPTGYAVFVHKARSTVWISPVQRETTVHLVLLFTLHICQYLLASKIWPSKCICLLLSVDKYIQYVIKPWNSIFSPVPCFLFVASWLFAIKKMLLLYSRSPSLLPRHWNNPA